jgi:predicted nucleotidyltransferase
MALDIQTIKNTVCELAPAYGVAKVSLFGSFARGEATEDSDIDLLVELDRPLGFRRGRMCLEIEDRLGRHVDVVFSRGQLYPPVREHIEKDEVVLYVG